MAYAQVRKATRALAVSDTPFLHVPGNADVREILGGRCFLHCFMGSMAALIQQPGRLLQLHLKCHGVYNIVSAALTAVLTNAP